MTEVPGTPPVEEPGASIRAPRLDDLPIMAWSAGADGESAFVSRALRSFVGAAGEDTGAWQHAIHPADRPDRDAVLAAAGRDTGQHIVEYRLRHANGQYRWIEERIEPGPAGLAGILTDITRWRGAERNQQLLHELDVLLREREDTDTILRTAVERLRAWLGADLCSFSEVDVAANSLTVRAELRTSTPAAEGSFELTRYLLPEVVQEARTGSTLVFDDLVADARTAAAYADGRLPAWLRSALLVPTVVDGQWTGLLIVAGHEPRVWREDEIALVESAAARVWAVARAAHADSERRHAERIYRTLVDTLPALIALSGPDLKPFYFNRYALEFTGLSQEELQEPGRINLHHPDDLPGEVAASLRDRAIAGSYLRGRVRLRTRDGEYRWHDVINQPVLDDAGAISLNITIAVDIEDQHRAEQALADQERMLRLATSAASVGVWSLDYGDDHYRASDEFYEVLGIPPGTPLTRDGLLDFIHPEDRERIGRLQTSVTSLQDSTPINVEYRLLRPDGAVRWASITGEIRFDEREPGQPVEATGVIVDITERKQLIEDLRKANAIKDEFLALVSHELRTPLTTLVGMSRMLRRRLHVDDPDLAGVIDQMVLDSSRLQMLVENMLVLSRLDYEHVSLEPVLLQRLAAAAIEQHHERYPSRVINAALEADLPPVEGQPGWCEQILQNLLSNAEKYSPPDEPIEVHASIEDERVWIHVSDHGPGISDEDITRIFEPFYRVESTASRQPGAGIGLTVCTRLAELQRGEIRVARRAEGGSTFSIGLCAAAL